MQSKTKLACLAAAGLIGVVGCAGMQSSGPKGMTFFVTSAGPARAATWAASRRGPALPVAGAGGRRG